MQIFSAWQRSSHLAPFIISILPCVMNKRIDRLPSCESTSVVQQNVGPLLTHPMIINLIKYYQTSLKSTNQKLSIATHALLTLIQFYFLLMSEELNGVQGMELVRQSTARQDELFLAQPPMMFPARRRKSKILTNRKTNEDLIIQSHEELMRYVDSVDSRVQTIIQTYQIQFLAAYRMHIKRVRQEMEMIKKLNNKNAQSQKLYLETIDNLQKELKIFREESLKLFDKIATKDKEIADLNIRIREFVNLSNESQKTIVFLTKRNKQLQANIEKVKQKFTQLNPNKNLQLMKRQTGTANKPHQLSSFISKDVSLEKDGSRPFTSAYSIKNKNISLRIQSNPKLSQNLELSDIKQKLQQKVGPSKLMNVDAIMQILSQSNIGLSKQPRQRLYEKISKRRASSFRMIQNEGLKMRSEELAQKTDYLNIFKGCVQELKKDIIRRNNIPSINFFKENGPKSFIEFKKVQKYILLELFLKNQQVLKKFYQLLFTNINDK